MIVCFFGYPNETYSRSAILIDGLKKNGVSIVSCTDKTGSAFTRYIKLWHKFWPLRHKVDAIFVQFPGHLNVPIAWLIGKIFRKPVIFDAFISLYDTYVFDREIAQPNSLAARFYWWVDKIACSLADKVTLDTYAHIRYFVKTFSVSRKKFYRVPVGGDDTLFKPRKHSASRKITIEFHGMFTKIHGAEIFIKVAKSLERNKKLQFWLIGDNPNYRLPVDLYHQLQPKNMQYWPALQVQQLAKKIAQADISVGHLGPTQKSKMVLTNKMYHAISSKVALIAGESQASRELLVNKQTAYFVKLYNETSLRKAILNLANNSKLRHHLASSGYQLHEANFTNKVLGKGLLEIMENHK